MLPDEKSFTNVGDPTGQQVRRASNRTFGWMWVAAFAMLLVE